MLIRLNTARPLKRKAMSDLSKHTELVNINFDGENAGLAVCHVSQGYSANGRPDALLLKSNQPVTKATLDSLKDVYPAEVVSKMTYNSKRSYLDTLIEEAIKATSGRDYVYVYISDFNEDMVAFNYEDTMWAVSYKENPITGVISLEGTPVKTFRSEIYLDSETGETLIKAAAFNKLIPVTEEVNNLVNTPDTTIQKENKEMAEVKLDVQELLKSSEAQELLKAMAADLAKAQFEELQKAAQLEELTKSTSEILKGFEVVADAEVEGIVKCLVGIDQTVAGTLLKAMGDMQAEIVKAKAEAEEVKKEFGEKQATKEVAIDVNKGNEDRAAQLASVVNKMKSK